MTKPIPTQNMALSLVEALKSQAGTGNETILIQEHSKWTYYHKPVTLIALGVLLFLSGILLSGLYFSHVADVSSALGPVCLSIGLMFLVTGIVWLLIVKQTLRYDGLLPEKHERRSWKDTTNSHA